MGGKTPFPEDWFTRHPVRVAFDLLGATFVVRRGDTTVAARIVEVEAYGGLEDKASHASMYRVGRQTLASGVGILYMQFAYGLHTMTNIVSHERGELGAVLIRAAEDPVDGLDLARSRRAPRDHSLLVGPACFSQGMGTLLSDTLVPLGTESGIMVVPGERPEVIMASTRIGITKSADAPWRFFDGDSRFVSRHRRGEAIQESDLDRIIDHLPIVSSR